MPLLSDAHWSTPWRNISIITVRLKARPRLQSRRPFAQSAIELMEFIKWHESIARWTQHQWLEEWKKPWFPHHSFPPPIVGNPDLGLSRSAWCKMNHLRRRVGCFRESLYRWKMASDPWCPSGSGEVNTADHTISGRCAPFRMPVVNTDLASPPPALCAWLEENGLAM